MVEAFFSVDSAEFPYVCHEFVFVVEGCSLFSELFAEISAVFVSAFLDCWEELCEEFIVVNVECLSFGCVL